MHLDSTKQATPCCDSLRLNVSGNLLAFSCNVSMSVGKYCSSYGKLGFFQAADLGSNSEGGTSCFLLKLNFVWLPNRGYFFFHLGMTDL